MNSPEKECEIFIKQEVEEKESISASNTINGNSILKDVEGHFNQVYIVEKVCEEQKGCPSTSRGYEIPEPVKVECEAFHQSLKIEDIQEEDYFIDDGFDYSNSKKRKCGNSSSPYVEEDPNEIDQWNEDINISSCNFNSGSIKCQKCGLYFKNNVDLENHILSVHKNPKNSKKCLLCFNFYSSNGKLRKHIDTVHHKLRPFECPDCHSKFSSKSSLARHVTSIHQKLNPFKCAECDSAFLTENSLFRHIDSVHKKLKPFKCAKCDSRFSRKAHLTGHMTSVHYKLKSFKCAECDLAFSEKGNLIKHVSTIHQKLRPFKCTECISTFTKRAYLLRHEYSIHKKQKPFKCPHCEKAFGEKRNFNTHISNCAKC